MYKYNFRFCWPSFTNGPVRHEPVKLHFKNQCTSLSPAGLYLSHGTRRTLLLLSAGKMTSSNRGEVGKAASGVNALGVTDLTAHPPTAWCRWPWAEAGRIHGGGRGEQGEGWRVGGVKVGSAGQRHHQQHVRWDDDGGCSLNPFPAAAPEPSTAGIRLPETTHTHTQDGLFCDVHYHISLRVLWLSSFSTDVYERQSNCMFASCNGGLYFCSLGWF